MKLFLKTAPFTVLMPGTQDAHGPLAAPRPAPGNLNRARLMLDYGSASRSVGSRVTSITSVPPRRP